MNPTSVSPIDPLRRLQDAHAVAVAVWSNSGRILEGNHAFLALTGWTRELLEQREFTWSDLVAPESAATVRIMRALLDELGVAPPFEILWQTAHGIVPVVIVATTLDRTSGIGWLFAIDLRTHKATEEALRTSEERYRLVTHAAGGVLWEWNLAEKTIVFGEGLQGRFGWDIEGVAVPLNWWHERVHREDVGALLAAAEEVHASRVTTATHAYRLRRADGDWAMVHDHFHVERDADGNAIGVFGVMIDATERHALEEQLRQAQKMDAVGRLAGGIAHDFNNLLTIIRGNASLALEQLAPDSPLRIELTQIEDAASRATELTRQLLAFSRKQVLMAQPLDVNAIVAQFTRMLDRLLPSSIALKLTPAGNIALIKADRGQLEQVILNLVINARDAMPNGGSLEIRTGEFSIGSLRATEPSIQEALDVTPPSNVPMRPGQYVYLAVTDTGQGMDADTRLHAFEPFFTTKAVGLGTGLGLATVYGIVKQSDGYVWIDSLPGAGTTVHVALPRYLGETRPARATPASVPVTEAPRTILLVEDEDGVRELALRVLSRQGYHVLVARDGVEALAIWSDNPALIDVVVTDVVMPRLGGSELVTRLRNERNEIPVLYMSGYARNAAIGDGAGDKRTRFLQKPFTVTGLVHAVAELVGGAGRAVS